MSQRTWRTTRSPITVQMQTYCLVCQWKNFENQLIQLKILNLMACSWITQQMWWLSARQLHVPIGLIELKQVSVINHCVAKFIICFWKQKSQLKLYFNYIFNVQCISWQTDSRYAFYNKIINVSHYIAYILNSLDFRVDLAKKLQCTDSSSSSSVACTRVVRSATNQPPP